MIDLFFRHEELLRHQGHYYEMWQQQLTKLDDGGDSNSINGEQVEVTVEKT